MCDDILYLLWVGGQRLQCLLINSVGNTDGISGYSFGENLTYFCRNVVWSGRQTVGYDDGCVIDERAIALSAEHLSTHSPKSFGCCSLTSWIWKTADRIQQTRLVLVPKRQRKAISHFVVTCIAFRPALESYCQKGQQQIIYRKSTG